MVFTSVIGAIYKNVTLGQVPDLPQYEEWWTPLEYAAWLIPSCLTSSWCAARLSHRLPLRAIRTVFVGLVLVAAWRLLV